MSALNLAITSGPADSDSEKTAQYGSHMWPAAHAGSHDIHRAATSLSLTGHRDKKP